MKSKLQTQSTVLCSQKNESILITVNSLRVLNVGNSSNKQKYLNNASKAKVGNFYNVIVTDENVSCSEVAVDIVLRLKVSHSTRYLCCNINKLRQLQRSPSTCQLHHLKHMYRCSGVPFLLRHHQELQEDLEKFLNFRIISCYNNYHKQYYQLHIEKN